jgi:HTH-type transcriptional regulator / antitoxin HigA
MENMNFTTDVPHPGLFIREELEARGWSQRDLAYILGIAEQNINVILSGKRGISPEMAKALGEAFDVTPELFTNLQNAYDMARARAPDPSVARRAKIQSAYPVREMIKRGWFADTDAPLLEAQLTRFFKVNRIEDVPHFDHAAKKTHYDDVPAPQLAWLFRVRQIAEATTVARYSREMLLSAIARFKQFLSDPEEIRHVHRLLSECGVCFVLVESLPNSKIDGVCFWIGPTPVIGMSIRHDRIDNFWFVLRHEIEHVLQGHGRTKEVIDTDLDNEAVSISDEERVANSAAADFCVANTEISSFIARKNPFFAERDVLAFAGRVGVHPGIVVGQIQKKTKRWDLLRRHLIKIRQFALSGGLVDGWGVVAPMKI